MSSIQFPRPAIGMSVPQVSRKPTPGIQPVAYQSAQPPAARPLGQDQAARPTAPVSPVTPQFAGVQGQPMMPDPSKQVPQIGVPARGQGAYPSPGVQVQTGPVPSFASHHEMRQAMLSGLAADMRQAHAAGDHAALYDLFAQRAALDNGGFQGHARYIQERDLAAAQRQKLAEGVAARSGGMPVGPDGLIDENAARQTGWRETNSVAGGDAFANNAAIQNLQTRIARGEQVQLPGQLADEVIASKAAHLAPLFATDNQGVPVNSGRQILEGLAKSEPGIFSDPHSLTAQAASQMLRQLHGDNIRSELRMPVDPQEWMAPPFKQTGIGWLDRSLDYIPRTGAFFGSSLDNLAHWREGVADPEGAYLKQKRANQLYDLLTNSQQ